MGRKKKKSKMINLSDTDYGNYIMSLKEERPASVITDKKEKNDKK